MFRCRVVFANFVTRLKDNAAYEVLEEAPVPANRNIRADQLIRFTGVKAQNDCPGLLRRVVVWDAVNEREIELLTNLQEFGPTTVAALLPYRLQLALREVRGARLAALRAAQFAKRDSVRVLARVRIVQRRIVQLLTDCLLYDMARDGAEVAISRILALADPN